MIFKVNDKTHSDRLGLETATGQLVEDDSMTEPFTTDDSETETRSLGLKQGLQESVLESVAATGWATRTAVTDVRRSNKVVVLEQGANKHLI